MGAKTAAFIIFLAATLGLGAPSLRAQCQDERSMADAMVKGVADVVDTVKKESQADFESKFHQKGTLNKLTFAIGAVSDAVTCLGKATADAAAATAKDGESKLKDRLTQYKTSLKSADDPKAAKELISTFDLAAAPAPATSAAK